MFRVVRVCVGVHPSPFVRAKHLINYITQAAGPLSLAPLLCPSQLLVLRMSAKLPLGLQKRIFMEKRSKADPMEATASQALWKSQDPRVATRRTLQKLPAASPCSGAEGHAPANSH